jgi:hypothetical protein
LPTPLETIPFSVPGGKELSLIDVIRYRDPYVYVAHQFGLFRINAYTGAYIQRTGVGYNNSAFPPSDIPLYLIGDHNQSVSTMVVNDTWVVTDCIAPTEGTDPAAIVWNNNAGLTYKGRVNKASGYWWLRAGDAILDVNFNYVENDRFSYDKMNVSTLAWLAQNVTPPADTSETDIGGYTYTASSADGSSTNYKLTRSGASSFTGVVDAALLPMAAALAGTVGAAAAFTGTITASLAPFSASATATQSFTGTISASFSPFAAAFVPQFTSHPPKIVPVMTTEELEMAVASNTEFNTCPLPHDLPDTSFHKEPLIAESPGSPAVGVDRSILHVRNPSGTWSTTTIGVPSRQ